MSQSENPAITHSCLEACRGVAAVSADLSDRQKLGILLQGAALLCHLSMARCRLVDGWSRAHVDDDGLLNGLSAEPGADDQLPQVRLRGLARSLFRTEREVGGRGEARRAVRLLLARWDQELTPLAAEESVRQILDSSTWLWQPAFGPARTTLAAGHRNGRGERLWVAGPSWFREALLSRAKSAADLGRRLQSDGARKLWQGNRLPVEQLAQRGQWREVVSAWRGCSRQGSSDRLDFARALFSVGRYRETREEVRGMKKPEAVVLRLSSLQRLGELRTCKARLDALNGRKLPVESLQRLAAVAVRVFGNLGKPGRAEEWAQRAASVAEDGESIVRADLIAFAAAWDRADEDAMRRHLEAARKALDVPVLAWRWHRAAGLEAVARGDGKEAEARFHAALASARRMLTPVEAGDLWNEMALARSLRGDLGAAERALLHTLHLHREAEGPRRTTLALFNLAEIRLRRGRLLGVREILEASEWENRSAGNWRGVAHDAELGARFDLVRGLPGSAVERLDGVFRELDERSVRWRRSQLRTLRARALGWLGRSEEAMADLQAAGEAGQSELEPEERPAMWALAGSPELARSAITPGHQSASLWSAVLGGEAPAARMWQRVDLGDDYRLARFAYDLECCLPGSVPGEIRQRAATALRAVGAAALARRLDGRGDRSWEGLARYLENGRRDRESLARLFDECGQGETRLLRRQAGDEEILLAGPGGEHELIATRGESEFVASSPWVDPVLRVLLRLAVRDLPLPAAEIVSEPRRGNGRAGIVGESRVLRDALDKLVTLAPESIPILLLGETGTGKELAAKCAHAASSRSSGPFLPLNCAAVSEELLMSDLFGHVRGAYTGAVRDRVGVFEAARAGTVFLDEIGDLPLRAQGYLLRVLQEGEVRRVGESLSRSTDVRVITATHRDLEGMVREGLFREDLFYRLRVASVVLPPLRERGSDVVLLARHFLLHLRPEATPRLTAAARAALRTHDWPGNVRELQNVLSVAVASAGRAVRPEHLDLPSPAMSPDSGYHEKVLEFRRDLVRQALERSAGNRAEAARGLGLSRQALTYLVRKLEI